MITSAHLGVVVAILGGAFGQLLMKSGVQSLPFAAFNETLSQLLYNPMASLLIVIGIYCYVVSLMVWVHTLQHYELSKAYPLLSLGYVVVYVGAAFWPGLQESFTTNKTIGIVLIVFGVWYSQSSNSTENG